MYVSHPKFLSTTYEEDDRSVRHPLLLRRLVGNLESAEVLIIEEIDRVSRNYIVVLVNECVKNSCEFLIRLWFKILDFDSEFSKSLFPFTILGGHG